MGKLESKLKQASLEFAEAEAHHDKQIDKVLARILANRTISKKRARKLFEAQEETNRLSARVEHLEWKLTKKAAKKHAKAEKRDVEVAKVAARYEGETVEDAASNHAAEDEPMKSKEQLARELSEFAYKPTRATLPNPSNPYSREDYDYMASLLNQRVKPSRYKHSLDVAETAGKMAEAYGLDVAQARMAGLLHDWDKALDHEHLARRVADYDLDIDASMVAEMPWVLHGPTAAAVLRDQFPEFRTPVFSAIKHHTIGAISMSRLDMVIMCADKLEPGHDVPVYRALYDQIGVLSLEDIFFQVLKEGLVYVLDSARPLSQQSVDVWNWYVEHLI